MTRALIQTTQSTYLSLVLVLLSIPTFAAANPITSSTSRLIIKARNISGGWSVEDFQDSLVFNPIADQIDSLSPAFPGLDSWARKLDFPASQYFVAELRPGNLPQWSAQQLGRSYSVLSAQPDYRLTDAGPALNHPPIDDPKVKNQWHLERIEAFAAWKFAQGNNQKVADIESGFDTTHIDLLGRFDLDASFDYDPLSADPTVINDGNLAHGTAVSGIIAASADNGKYGAGIAPKAQLIGCQIDVRRGWTLTAAQAILGAIESKADVILIEKQVPALYSSVERVKVIYDAIRAATKAGIPVIVPAGNFRNELKEEAKLSDSGSIMVAASGKDNTLVFRSNYGERVNLRAPGQDLYTLAPNQGERNDFGETSGAAAIVAGVVALIRERNPNLNPWEIRKLLVETALKMDTDEAKRSAGPLVNARRALEWLLRD